MKIMSCVLSFLFSTAIACAGTITVTSLSDSGNGTLRQAITTAQNGDTIQFDSMLSGTIALASPLPLISVNNLKIEGPSDNSISIDGNSQYRIFNVQVNPFTVSHLNLNNGANVQQGGAVFVQSNAYAYLKDVVITPSMGTYGSNALYADPDGVLDLTDVTFTSSTTSQVYLNAGTMNVTCNSPLEFIVDGVGGGQIMKFGNASAAISAPMSVATDYYLTVSNGALSFSGESIESALILADGELQGSFRLSDVANLGGLMPGEANTFGTLHFSNDFISVEGETKIKVDPSGNCDLILVGGDVYLFSGSLTLIPASGTYPQGTVFTFLTSTGGMNGQFNAVSLGGLDAQVNYNANSIEIEILNDSTI
ncbi:MAG: hypothetical protein K2P51_07740 [Rhabdochlamydiaceae bacterium]|nr:hypothetical protein [Rhabdochlamydiaceae bacterium]